MIHNFETDPFINHGESPTIFFFDLVCLGNYQHTNIQTSVAIIFGIILGQN